MDKTSNLSLNENRLKSMQQLKKHKRQKLITVVVSGGFDPVHVGHIRLFQEAKKMGDKLIVIINNDNWLLAKKGYVFMPQNERNQKAPILPCRL